MSRDIFPPLGIPTIYVAQPYGGMDPAQMEGYLTYRYEYHFLYIAGISHVESKSIQGASIMKLQFHPETDMSQALSETIAYVNRSRAFMPEGTPAPFVTRFEFGGANALQTLARKPPCLTPEFRIIAVRSGRPRARAVTKQLQFLPVTEADLKETSVISMSVIASRSVRTSVGPAASPFWIDGGQP